MAQDPQKNYPSASDEMSQLFGLQADSDPSDTSQFASASSPMPSNLPILEGQLVTESDPMGADTELDPDVVSQKPQTETQEYTAEKNSEAVKELEALVKETKPASFMRGLKKAAPYLAVFAIGIFVYYFYFTDFSFKSLLSNAPSIQQQEEKNAALDALIAANRSQYDAWIKQFYFEVRDPAIVDPYADNSGNGLTNFQKFLLNLNPKEYDTLNLGMADGQAVVQGIDPSTGKDFSKTKKSLIEKYFDLEAISNKLAAGAVANVVASNADSANQVLGVQTAQASYIENSLGLNTDAEILLEVPSLNVTVPIIWTKNTKDFDADLQNGVVHYPGTAIMGDIGTSYISGHSSNYAWSKGKYNQVFVNLDDLKDGDSFSITATKHDGSKVKLHYVVKRHAEFAPNDQEQFISTSKSVVALSTCWPPGTTARRLVAFGELTQTENLN